MLQTYRSNRIEALAALLAHQLRERPLADPVAPDVVVVHSTGMERWLSHQLAHHLGISANVRFPFPGALVEQAIAAARGAPAPEVDPWSPDSLAWSVLGVLPDVLDQAVFAPIRGYLGDARGPVDRRRYLLARRIADTLDAYATYRPRWVRDWQSGGSEGLDARDTSRRWQPRLWERLAAHLDAPHLADRLEQATAALRAGEAELSGFPERVSFFGTSTLPPPWLDLLAALSEHVEVDLYLLAPSHAWWGDLRSNAEAARSRRRAGASPELERQDRGNPLLASFGRLARDFQKVLEQCAEPGYREAASVFVDIAHRRREAGDSPTLLEVLQSDVLNLHDPTDPDPDLPARTLEPHDRSFQVHACHGATRQVEILRDTLLTLMSEPTFDPPLEPRDILVMCPDLERFAPLVSAVFSDGDDRADAAGPTGAPRLPFRIADRSVLQQNPVAEALSTVLELASGRLPASGILDLLGLEPVRSRFGIDADDLPTLRTWVVDSGIRWGLDAPHRHDFDQPAVSANTWQFGLDRLLLGVCMQSDADRTFGDVLPYDEIEGSATSLLGRFTSFCDALFRATRELERARPLAAWADVLIGTLDALTHTSHDQAWLGLQVRERLTALARRAEASTFRGLVALDAIRAVLDGAFHSPNGSVGQQTGSITFSAMVPMRSIPYRVICILGLDDGAYPRVAPRLGFDLLAAHPALGDRDPRDEDRFILLEALLAARDAFVVTYSGRDVRTNEHLPPAVPLGEILDIVDATFPPSEQVPSARAHVVTEHPLQPFSAGNFGVGPSGERIPPRSFDRRMLQGAARLAETPESPAPFFVEPLASRPVDAVSLEDLARFFQNPCRPLIRTRLGVQLGESVLSVADREPIELDGLERWSIGDRLLRGLLDGRPTERTREILRACGLLPIGVPGERELDRVEQAASAIAEAVAPHLAAPARPVPVDLEFGGTRMVGTLPQVHGDQLLDVRFGAVHARHRIAAWVRHLAAQVAEPGVPFSTVVVGRSRKEVQILRFAPREPAQAEQDLSRLVDLYRRGLHEPLRFFPESSLMYAAALYASPEAHDKALASAYKAWLPGYQSAGESTDPWIRQAFDGRDPLSEAGSPSFPELACAVWNPVLDAEDA